MSNKLIYLLGGLFLILSPLSVVSDVGASGPAKYLRIVTTMLVVLLGVATGSVFRGRTATVAFVPFVALWLISPVWSQSPLWGLFYKGMFALTFVSGLVLALSPRTLSEMESGLKLLGPVSFLTALAVLFEYITNPEGSTVHGRMAISGVNANYIAQTAAPIAVLCAYLALFSTRPMYKKISIAAFALLFMILLLTGSRGGIMMALIGSGVVTLPLAKKPGVILLAIGVLFGCGFVAFELLNVSGEARALDELTKDTRSGVWSRAIQVFTANPLLGRGWLVQYGKNSWATVQSSYIQVLAETGIVGALCLGGAILALVPTLLKARRAVKTAPNVSRLWYLCAACLAASLFHGAVESSMVVGTSLTPLLLGFGVGLVDRIPVFARMDTGSQYGNLRWAWVWVPHDPATGLSGGAVSNGVPDQIARASGV